MFLSCDKDMQNTHSDNFDRGSMLAHWADNIIIPAYQSFQSKISSLKDALDTFKQYPNTKHLGELRKKWQEAYLSWQDVSLFDIGPAEDILYRDFMNVYPTSIENINKNITSGIYDLTSISLQDEQGFPALDYLLNGIATNDVDILHFYISETDGNKYLTYLSHVINRMDSMTQQVLTAWTSTYRDDFVNNSGSSSSSSVDKFVNDFIFYYERILRAGKIGIPAGVFSDDILPTHTEAYYKKDISKDLFNEALNTVQHFYNGKYYNDTTMHGESLKSYLIYLNTIKNSTDLATLIDNQFNIVRAKASKLKDNFSYQVSHNNTLMLETYDALQTNVVLLKVDMLQAMDINVDYVDADGD